MESLEQQLADLDRRTDVLEGILRIGIVTERDCEKELARVSWHGNRERSAWLKVVHQRKHWMPQIGDTVLSIHRPGCDGDGWILGRY